MTIVDKLKQKLHKNKDSKDAAEPESSNAVASDNAVLGSAVVESQQNDPNKLDSLEESIDTSKMPDRWAASAENVKRLESSHSW